jgi:hypothetical protein
VTDSLSFPNQIVSSVVRSLLVFSAASIKNLAYNKAIILERIDHGHLHPLLEHLRRTCSVRGMNCRHPSTQAETLPKSYHDSLMLPIWNLFIILIFLILKVFLDLPQRYWVLEIEMEPIYQRRHSRSTYFIFYVLNDND